MASKYSLSFKNFNFFSSGLFFLLISMASAKLSSNFYATTCPKALATIKSGVNSAVSKEARMGASLLRLHFHDCFVNASLPCPFFGCDASILLDDTASFKGEQKAGPNNKSLRGYEVIDSIKSKLESLCPAVVSCADIVAVAARDSVVALGGPSWKVRLGRRDSTTASRTQANLDTPSPLMDLPALINNFKNQGLNQKDLVALSGGHTIGFAQCFTFRNRTYSATNIDPTFAKQLQETCPRTGGNTNLAPLDPTPATFDSAYFNNLVKQRGLLISDQALFSGGSTDDLVKTYSSYPEAFSYDFAKSMIKMGNIKPLTGNQGQIRVNCRKVNYY
ncbi:hypothetical protein PTKIN_Ptkin17bG0007900 [Pterospermum kingtungense]